VGVEVVVEGFGSAVAQRLVASLAEKLRSRYAGRGGSGGEPPASYGLDNEFPGRGN
jgi:hypothetical protein